MFTPPAAEAAGCPENYPGGPVAFLFVGRDGRAFCGATASFGGAPVGQDIVLLRNTRNAYVPGGYFCDGDIAVYGSRFFSGGDLGAQTVVLTFLATPRNLDAPYGADCQPGGFWAMWSRCMSDFDAMPWKLYCAFYYDPDGAVPWADPPTAMNVQLGPISQLPANVTFMAAYLERRPQQGYFGRNAA